MHIRRSTLVIFSGASLLLTVILLLSTGWIRSSFAPNWKLQGHWGSWKDYIPFQKGHNATEGGVAIGDEPGITPTYPDKEKAPGAGYAEIAVKDKNLREKLTMLLSRPVLSHEEALKLNMQGCPIEVANKQVCNVTS